MKKVFTFSVNEKQEVEEKKEVEVNGEKLTKTEKVTKEVPKTFFIKKPTRILWDDAELYSGSVWSESLKRGMLTEQLLFKRYANEGGVFSDAATQKRKELAGDLSNEKREYQRLEATPEKTEEIKQKIEESLKKIAAIRDELINYERVEQSLFQNTAEARARAKTTIWWVLQLAYQEVDGKETPIFGNGSYEDRLKVFDEFEEKEDPFWTEVIQRFIFYITFYMTGRGKTEADFKEIEKLFKVDA